MLKIAICDDNEECIIQLEQCLRTFRDMGADAQWQLFYNAQELLCCEERSNFNVLITDIEMPQTNGIELANTIRKENRDIIIFFLSSHTEYAIECFEPDPLNFWVKPPRYDVVEHDLNRAMERIKNSQRSLTLRDKNGVRRIRYDDIIYLEKKDRKTAIHTVSGVLVTNRLLSELCWELDEDLFVRIYQSYVINIEYVKILKGKSVTLYDVNEELPVGRTYTQKLKKAFFDFCDRRAFDD